VTPQLSATTAFDRKAHRVDRFSCGEALLDRWLIAYAGQNQQRDAARTFVDRAPFMGPPVVRVGGCCSVAG
jgi:hypothetical protein